MMNPTRPARPFRSRTTLFATTMLSLGFSGAALAEEGLPTGGSVAAGIARISATEDSLTVNQSSARAVLNWNSFSVGQNRGVIFNQPDAQSATLNRVTGDTTSTIAGNITSNGAVYLINPNGIAITKSGTVQTGGGFVASTLGMTDDDFMAGRNLFSGNGSSGTVSNAGAIAASQGAYVALLGGAVSNSGTISVPLGKIGLGSGEQIALDINGGNFLQVAVPTSLLTGSNALIDNSGSISAGGGRIELKAAVLKDAVRNIVNMSGSLNADSATGDGGTIHLIGGADTASMAGNVTVSGSLSARSTGAQGNGGFIETSGAHIDLNGAKVSTLAAGGIAGTWLIDPTDFTVASSGGDITGAQLATNLGGGNVTIASSSGASGTNGDILVNDAVSWSSGNSLTLNASSNIGITSAISAPSGGLALTASGTISASAAVNVGLFDLVSGNWVQNIAALPGFAVNDFRINLTAASFLRVKGGAGTSANPYQIADVYGLQGIASTSLLAQNYVLANSIDASGTANWNSGLGFVPIGTNGLNTVYNSGNGFTGSLDGANNVISGLTINRFGINRTGYNNIGLFGVTSGASIANVALSGANIAGDLYVGGLIGYAFGGTMLSNVGFGGTFNSSECYACGTLVGRAGNVTIRDSSVAVNIAAGNFTNFVGGLVGSYEGNLSISNVQATGSVTGGNVVGGLVGGYYSPFGSPTASLSITNTTSSISVTAPRNYVGGLVGLAQGPTSISNTTVSGTVNGTSSNLVGGLVGESRGAITITNSSMSGAVTGKNNVGGLVGHSRGSTTITNGLISISNSAATGSVTASENNVGGLVGFTEVATTISNSYSSGTASGANDVGGLIGYANAAVTITDAYASGAVSGGSVVGGLVGRGAGGSLTRVYASGLVTGGTFVGGLVGSGISSATGAFWDKQVSGLTAGSGDNPALGTGVTTAQLRTLGTFTAPGWSIDATGGTSSVWRIYDGLTAPLLRSFLTPLAVSYTPDFDGSSTALNTITSGTLAYGAAYDAGKVLGSADAGSTLTLASTSAGSYNANVVLNGLYSTQQGYDLITTSTARTILTSGSAAGDVRLDNALNWTNGTLKIDTSGTISASGAINGGSGSTFNLTRGNWVQNNAALPDFAVNDFRVSATTASFLRVKDGVGTSVNPYQIADVYGLQGIGSVSLLGQNFLFANSIDASVTANWNGGAGFTPFSNIVAQFSGSLDGSGHTLSNLVINLPTSDYVGLFGYVSTGARLSNLGLIGGSITGRQNVGALAGFNGGSISNSYATTSVRSTNDNAGGLVGSNTGAITASYASGAVSGGRDNTGGLIGINNSGGSVSNSYATSAVSAARNGVGGLLGLNDGAITNTYSTGAVNSVSGALVGGLVGYNNSAITNSYATGAVTGTAAAGFIGGLVGLNSLSTGSVIGSFWNTQTTGRATSDGGTGLTTAQMRTLANFTSAGWSIDAIGGTSSIWRSYDGQAAPLLRSFLTPLSVSYTPDFDGSSTPLSDIAAGSLVYGAAYDASKVLGSAAPDSTLTLTSTTTGSYTASVGQSGLYSTQQGYDLITNSAARTILTPGSAAGDVRLDNGLRWTNGTLRINTSGTISANNFIIGGAGSSFVLAGGNWVQNGPLPEFTVNSFSITGGSFLRSFTGDGSLASPYRITDIYGLQGIGSASLLNKNFALLGDIDAAGTANWNGGAGFAPIGTFTGTLFGQGASITGLRINRPATDGVGLFSELVGSGRVTNVNLVGGSVTGRDYVGSLVAINNGGTVDYASSSATVAGRTGVGGLLAYNASTVNNSYATGNATGRDNVGGLAGLNFGSIANAYATGAVVGGDKTGGLVGYDDGNLTNTYASGSVSGTTNTGGLVGQQFGGTVTASFWNTQMTGQASSPRGTGLTTAQIKALSTFTAAGWSIDAAGGTGSTWRIYEGQTAPLLRSFLTPLTVNANSSTATYNTAQQSVTGYTLSNPAATLLGTAVDIGGTGTNAGTYAHSVSGLYSNQQGYDIRYAAGNLTIDPAALVLTPLFDGSATPLTNIAAYSISGSYDPAQVSGGADTLIFSGGAADSYSASIDTSGITTSTNYTLSAASNIIFTPGSAAGDIRLDNSINWTNGTLRINTSGTITAGAINGGSGSSFVLAGGDWVQNGATLPGFAVNSFAITGGTFLRTLGGDGSAGAPWLISDVYGLQGMRSASLLTSNFALANNIDASGTLNWNAGAGFAPIGDNAGNFNSSFDGHYHSISGLVINRPASNSVGLFGFTGSNSTISHVGLLGGSVRGQNFVGGLAGYNQGTLSQNYVTSDVVGTYYVGGLVGENQGLLDQSYATGAVTGDFFVGGLVGINLDTISQSYATGAATAQNYAGGLLGYNLGTLSQSYATGAVTAQNYAGGLVGQQVGGGATTDSFWDTQTSGQSTSAGGTGLTQAQIKSLSGFGSAGWSIDGVGGTGSVWRIYDGVTEPLLRNFLTPLNLIAFDGSATPLTNIGLAALPAGTDMSKLIGTYALDNILTLTGSSTGDSYVASVNAAALSSTQQGYDITASRTIATPGSAAGDVRLDNAINWTNGTLRINAPGTITALGAINGGASSSFVLAGGNWVQNSVSLPVFTVNSFAITGGSFLRASGGNGSAATPWLLSDIYGLQGVGSLLSGNFALEDDIDASGAANWNTGAGFNPIGTASRRFSGSLNGQGHAISSLFINRPTTDRVGLFGYVGIGARISDLGLDGGSLTGRTVVGALAGNNAGTITNVHTTGVSVFVSDFGVGGLVGVNNPEGVITNSSATDSNVTALSGHNVGGLVGNNFGSISASFANVLVFGGGDAVGGLVGVNSGIGSIQGSYATGAVTGGSDSVGGLVGLNFGSITNAYATGAASANGNGVGGLVGSNAGTVNYAYATGTVSGASAGNTIGGLVGVNKFGTTVGTVNASFWDKQTTGQTTSDGGTGLTAAQLRNLGTFNAAGWSIDALGGTSSIWRSYDGQTAPLLRSFLTPLNLIAFDGSASLLTNIGLNVLPTGTDVSKLIGTYTLDNTLTLTSSGTGGSYLASVNATSLSSTQQGYDITASRTIATPGSAVGDIRLDNALNWTNGTLQFNASGTITANGAINGGAGSSFVLGPGYWVQNSAYLPAFKVNNFAINGGSFLRVSSGDGSAASPWLLNDIYGLQGVSGFLSSNFALATDIDASGTANWNAGAGFGSIGTSFADFVGSLDGRNHLISNLTINRPTTDLVGLFGFAGSSASISNLGLVGASVTGQNSVGLLAGVNQGAISNSYATGTATAMIHIAGGLVGYNFGGAINTSYASATVTANGNLVGGLAGVNGGTITNTYATGAATTVFGNYVGGLVGYNDLLGSISNSYATGAVTGTNSSSAIGGLVGFNLGGLVDASFWDTQSSGQSASAGGTGLTTTQIGSLGTFTGAGWSIDAIGSTANIWRSYDGQTAPLLRTFLTPLTATGNSSTVTYNGAQQSVTGYTLSNPAATLLGTATDIGGTGTNAGTYAHNISGLYSIQSGYDIVYAPGSLRVNAAPLSIAADGKTMIYGNTLPALTYQITTGTLLGSDALTGALTTTATSQSNVGNYQITQSTLGNPNYAITFANGVLSVTPRDLSLIYTADAATSIYGNAPASLSGSVTSSGLVNGDLLSGTASWLSSVTATSNVGSYAITGSGLSASSNYSLTSSQAAGNALAYGVTPRPLSVIADAQSRIYGNANPALTYVSSGLVNGDALTGSLETTAALNSNVGTYGITQGTLAASNNYTLGYTGANVLVTARPLSLTYTADAATSIYGNAPSSLSGSVASSGLVNGDLLSGTANWASGVTSISNVGSYAITGSGLSASSNYNLTSSQASGNASAYSVTVRPLSVIADAQSRIYGNANPALTYVSSGLVNGDALNGALVTSAGLTSNIGSYGITQGTLAASSNYTLGYTGANLSVTARPLSLTYTADAATSIYGNAPASLSGSVTSSGLVNGDLLSGTASWLSGVAVTSNVGSYGIIGSGLSASNNYSLTSSQAAGNASAYSVTARSLSVIADAQSRIYGNINPLLSHVSSGLVNGDALTGALVTSAGLTSNIGTYAITQGTLAATPNYTLNYTGATLSITARPLSLTYTANTATSIYGNAPTSLSGSVASSGLVNGDGLTGTANWTSTASATSNVGSFGITGSGLAASSNYRLTSTQATGNASAYSVTVRPLSVIADAQSRIYGNANPALTYISTGLVNGDALAGALATTAGLTSNIGIYGITRGSLAATPNYTLTYAGANLSVTARPLSLTYTADAATSIYGNAPASLSGNVASSGLVNGDLLTGTANWASAVTSNSNVGAYAITGSGLSASTNYSLTSSQATGNASAYSVTLRPTTVTYAATSASRIYGDANPVFGGIVAASNLAGGDTLGGITSGTASWTSGAGQFGNVGNYAVTGAGLTGNSGNYSFSFVQASGNASALSVTARPLSITADAQTRIYGNANPLLTYVSSGLVNGDALSGALATSAGLSSNVGSYGITQGTLSTSSNYTLGYTGAILSVTSRPVSLTYTADAATSIYGNAPASLSGSVTSSGLVNGDLLSGTASWLSSVTATSNVGSYAITGSGLSASSNYSLTSSQAAGNALAYGVTPRPLSVIADAQSRIYGNANPALTYNSTGLVNGDALTGALATTAGLTSNVGSHSITQGALAVTSNYTLNYTGATLSITARPLSLTYTAEAATSIYGNAPASLSGSVASSGLVNGDLLSGIANWTSSASPTSNVGAFAITGSGLTASSNYSLTISQAAGNASAYGVTARPLSVTADALSRIYGDANPALTYISTGLVNGDALTGALATSAGLTSNIGNYGITQGTLAASSNYALNYTQAMLSITPRALSVNALAQSRVYGDVNPALTYTTNGLVNGDILVGNLATAAVLTSNVGSYGIAQGTLEAMPNYALTYTGATLSVTPRPTTVTYTATAATSIYGNAITGITGNAAAANLVNADTLASITSGTATFGTSATGTSNVGTYAITGNGLLGASANYTVTFAQAAANATALTINPRPLSVIADSVSRTYGAANPALTFASSGLVNGDALSGALAAGAGLASDVGTYAINQGNLTATPNYVLTYTGGNLGVTPAPIIVTALGGSSIYGQSPTNPGLSAIGLQNGQTVTVLTGLSNSFGITGTNTVGTTTNSVAGMLTNGNYALTGTVSNPWVVNRAALALTYSASAASSIYGNALASLSGSVAGIGFVNGESVANLGGVALWASSVTSANGVGSYAISGSGLTSSNYTIASSQAASNASAYSVTPRAVTVTYTATPASRIYGDANSALSGGATSTGLVSGDTLAGVTTGTAAFSSVAGQFTSVGAYAINGAGLAGNNANYGFSFVQAAGNGSAFVITPRPLSVTADALNRIYGNANPALTYTSSGLVNGDTLTGALTTSTGSTSNIGTYAILQGSLIATPNYTLNYTGANLSITARPITITANPHTRLFGLANPALTYTVSGMGLANGDSLTGLLGTSAAQFDPVGLYPIIRNTLSASANYVLNYIGANLLILPVSQRSNIFSMPGNGNGRPVGNEDADTDTCARNGGSGVLEPCSADEISKLLRNQGRAPLR